MIHFSSMTSYCKTSFKIDLKNRFDKSFSVGVHKSRCSDIHRTTKQWNNIPRSGRTAGLRQMQPQPSGRLSGYHQSRSMRHRSEYYAYHRVLVISISLINVIVIIIKHLYSAIAQGCSQQGSVSSLINSQGLEELIR